MGVYRLQTEYCFNKKKRIVDTDIVNDATCSRKSVITRVTGWERTGQMLCIVDTSLSVLMTLRMCLRELCCLFTVWI